VHFDDGKNRGAATLFEPKRKFAAIFTKNDSVCVVIKTEF